MNAFITVLSYPKSNSPIPYLFFFPAIMHGKLTNKKKLFAFVGQTYDLWYDLGGILKRI